MSRGSTTTEITAGTTPIRTSLNAKVASWAAIATSHAATSPTPPARAGPLIRATTGVGDSQIVCRIRGTSVTPCCCAPAPRDSLRSMPEQNTRPVWVSTITRAAGSAIAASRWASSSRRSCADRALRLAGESSVIVATPAATSRWTSSSGSLTP